MDIQPWMNDESFEQILSSWKDWGDTKTIKNTRLRQALQSSGRKMVSKPLLGKSGSLVGSTIVNLASFRDHCELVQIWM